MLLQKFPKHFFVNFGLFQMSLKDGQKILLQKFPKQSLQEGMFQIYPKNGHKVLLQKFPKQFLYTDCSRLPFK